MDTLLLFPFTPKAPYVSLLCTYDPELIYVGTAHNRQQESCKNAKYAMCIRSYGGNIVS